MKLKFLRPFQKKTKGKETSESKATYSLQLFIQFNFIHLETLNDMNDYVIIIMEIIEVKMKELDLFRRVQMNTLKFLSFRL